MRTVHRIVDAQARPGYRLHVRFEDGTQGDVALSELVGKGVFAAWCDPAELAKVVVDSASHTVAWPNGMDLCPITLSRDVLRDSAVSRA